MIRFPSKNNGGGGGIMEDNGAAACSKAKCRSVKSQSSEMVVIRVLF